MIHIENLTKHYGSRAAVDRLDFTVQPGRVTGFLGPNGAGKSTTLRLIAGLDRADTGRALINGVPYHELRDPLRVVGTHLDGSGAHRGRTARNHLLWMALSNGIPKSRVGKVLELVGLAPVARARVGTFSLGMGQRLGLAAALLGDPSALLLDEPVNGLDPEGIRWMRTFLRDLAAEGRTVLVSSHLMSEMAHIADQVVVINQGRLVARGSVPEIAAGHASLEDAFFALTGASPRTSPGTGETA